MASNKQGSRNSSKRSSKHSSKESSESFGKHKSKPERSVSESGDDTSGSSSCSNRRSKNKKRSPSKHQTKLKGSAETHGKHKLEHLVSESGDDTSGSSSEREQSSNSKSKKHSSKQSSNESSSKKQKSKSKRSASQSNVESSDSSSESKKRSKKDKRHWETRDSLSIKTSSKCSSRRSHSESRQDPIKIPSKIVPLERRCGGLKINQGEHELFQLIPRDFINRKSNIDTVKPTDSGILILSPRGSCSGISTQVDDDTSSSRSSSKITVISAEFEETLPEIESSGVLIEPCNYRNSENTFRILQKLRRLDTIDSGICSTIEEVDTSNSRVTLRSEDISSIKYLLKQAESQKSGSRTSSRLYTPRDPGRSAFNTRSRQMKVLKPKEVELETEPLLLSPYLSPSTSKPSSPKSTRTPSPVLHRDTLPRNPENCTLGQENLTKLIAYLDKLDVRIRTEKVERETQEPDGIPLVHSKNGQYRGLRLHPDLPINAPHEQIQEFFANLPLPPLPNDSSRDQRERIPQENIRQRWQREFGEESDGNGESDNDVEEEDLEMILDLCNDRFLKQKYRNRR